ncbi:MAG: methyltransferase domain-containing protein [Pseudomonadales bacterium]
MSRLETLQSDGGAAVGPLADDIRQLAPWFHNLRLTDGSETAPDHPLGDFPSYQWRRIAAALPFDLAGMRVLDVGCNAGFYAFEMSRLGASVLAIDLDEHYLRQARWAEQHIVHGSSVEFRRASVYDVSGWGERYDLINFMGVFYHLRYPLLALDILASVCERWLIFQSITRGGDEAGGGSSQPPHHTPEDLALSQLAPLSTRDWPSLAFVEHRLAGDLSNWWVPNEPAVFALLRSAGFEVRKALAPETWLCQRVAERTGPRLEFSV